MRNWFTYVLLACCGELLCSCSPRLVHPEIGPCYWDFVPLIHTKYEYDIEGNVINKSVVHESRKEGDPKQVVCRENNFILHSRQGRVLIYVQFRRLYYVETYKLYVDGKKLSSRCVKIQIDKNCIFLDLKSKEVIYAYPEEFKFNDNSLVSGEKISDID